MRTTFPSIGAAAVAWLLAGCSTPGLGEVRISLPPPGEPAKLVVRVNEQTVPLRFEPRLVDHAEWASHPVDEAPPPPLEALPPGSRPVGAWVLRVRMRGTKALVPSVYLAERRGSGVLYTTRQTTGRLEAGAGFDVLSDGSVRVADPSAPPPVPGFLDVPVEAK